MPETPKCCEGCLNWRLHGKNCWYYWELKKHCTMWTPDIQEPPLQ